MRRFYKAAGTAATDGGYQIQLDGPHQLESWGADSKAAARLDRLRLEIAATGRS